MSRLFAISRAHDFCVKALPAVLVFAIRVVLGYCQKDYSLRFEGRPSASICACLLAPRLSKPLGLLRQALFALPGAVFKVLDGLFHAQGHVCELIEVVGQVTGETLLLSAACFDLLMGIPVCGNRGGSVLILSYRRSRLLSS